MSDKTEAPTPRRLRKARQDGDLPVSAALGQAVGFLVALSLVPGAVVATAWRTNARLHQAMSEPLPATCPDWLIGDVLTLTVPLVLATAVGAMAMGLVQTGGVVALKKLAPDLSRANPLNGLKNIFNAQRLVAIARALLAALLVGWLAWRAILSHGADFSHTIGSPAHAAVLAGMLAREVAWLAALVGLALAVLDFLVTRHLWFKRLKMSKDEVKREHKESEGDPEQKAARQRVHQEVLRGAVLAAVRRATVVVVNPTHLASALRYDEEEDEAPLILAQGRGELARRIVDEARANGIPVVRDIPVARALAELEEGEQIPEALYEAVAAILRDLWENEPPREAPESGR